MNIKKRKKTLIIIIFVALLLCSFKQTQAAGLLPGCIRDGSCDLCQMVQVVINIGILLIGISGAVTLLYIVYGGFVLLTSGGSQEKVTKGKKILIHSAIGLAIAFTAYMFITTFVSVVTNEWNWEAQLTCFETIIKPIITFT